MESPEECNEFDRDRWDDLLSVWRKDVPRDLRWLFDEMIYEYARSESFRRNIRDAHRQAEAEKYRVNHTHTSVEED